MPTTAWDKKLRGLLNGPPDMPPYSEVEACKQAGVYKSDVPAEVKKWKLWRIRRERMKAIYRHGECNTYAYSDEAETDDETKDLDYLKSPIERIGMFKLPGSQAQSDKQPACRPTPESSRGKASRTSKPNPKGTGQPRSTRSGFDEAVRQFAQEFGLSPAQEALAREQVSMDRAMMVMAGLQPDIFDAIETAGLNNLSLSKEAMERGVDKLMRERKAIVDSHFSPLDPGVGVATCTGLYLPLPYSASGHVRRQYGPNRRSKAIRPRLTVDTRVSAQSSETSSSSLSDVASTAITSVSSCSSSSSSGPSKIGSPSTICIKDTLKAAAPTPKVRPSQLSEADQIGCDLVAAIKAQALTLGYSLEERLHNVVIAIYGQAFRRGPCPPAISGLSGPPVDCNASPEMHIAAAQAFTHKIWSMSDPYAIKLGQWGLEPGEVYVLRMIIFVRCVAGWYKMDVEQGIVDEEYVGKGKEKSAWW